MANALQRSVTSTGSAIRRRYLERFTEPAALRRVMRRAEDGPIALDLVSDDVGAFERGAAILEGTVALAGTEAKIANGGLWTAKPPTPAWREAAHAFEWLEDLAAVGGETAEAWAREAILAWIAAHETYDPVVWRPALAARRLRAWLQNALLFFPEPGLGAPLRDADEDARIRRALWAHAEWVSRSLSGAAELAPQGLDKLRAASAAVLAGLAIEGMSARIAPAIAAIESVLTDELLPDGSWRDRSPQSALEALSLLTRLSQNMDLLGAAPPESLARGIAALGRAVRFHRMGDGGLPCMQGARELGALPVEGVLALIKGLETPPRRLPDAGFQKLVGGRATVLVDVGAAADGAGALSAHASALSLELCSGRRRIVVNCGAAPTLPPDRRIVFRAEGAHSTLVVADAPFTGRRRGRDQDPEIVGPPGLVSERKEERNGMWLIAAHGGYRERFGLAVSRRLFLSTDGGDFRGEDSLSVENDADGQLLSKALQKLPRARRDRGLPFAVRFHLHPDVAATMVADGEAVTLRLPHGEVWVMRQAGGAIGLEDSYYAGRTLGEPEPTRMIVIRGAARRELTQVRWAFRRVGELSQLPRDLEALGVTLEDADADRSSV